MLSLSEVKKYIENQKSVRILSCQGICVKTKQLYNLKGLVIQVNKNFTRVQVGNRWYQPTMQLFGVGLIEQCKIYETEV